MRNRIHVSICLSFAMVKLHESVYVHWNLRLFASPTLKIAFGRYFFAREAESSGYEQVMLFLPPAPCEDGLPLTREGRGLTKNFSEQAQSPRSLKLTSCRFIQFRGFTPPPPPE